MRIVGAALLRKVPSSLIFIAVLAFALNAQGAVSPRSYFISNSGQWETAAQFLFPAHGYQTWFSAEGMTHVVSHSGSPTLALRQKFLGGQPGRWEGGQTSPTKINWFKGPSAQWRKEIPTFQELAFANLYPGIDLRVSFEKGHLKSEYWVKNPYDYKKILIAMEGSESLAVANDGHLQIKTKTGAWLEEKPVVYQWTNGKKSFVSGSYQVKAGNTYGFEVTHFDPKKPLIIDPTLVYSTYLGGSAFDSANAVAVDDAGNMYVTGFTNSTDFPGNFPITNSYAGNTDAFVAKLTPDGSQVLFLTYLGGSGDDYAISIAVTPDQEIFLAGQTGSNDFPTGGAAQSVYGGGTYDCFITHLNASGNQILGSSYLGGNLLDVCLRVTFNSQKQAWVTGYTQSANMPTVQPLQGAFGGVLDAFVAQLSGDFSAFLFSTYLGGNDEDYGFGLAIDSQEDIYVSGSSRSSSFPGLNANSFQQTWGGGLDALVLKIKGDHSQILYSTLIGGNGEENAEMVAVDPQGQAYLVGSTSSTNFPTLNPLFMDNDGNQFDAFVSKFNAQGSSLIFSTYLGGSDYDLTLGIALDEKQDLFVAGETLSTDFPTTVDAFQTDQPDQDVFVSRISSDGQNLVYSSYLGGNGIDSGTGAAVDQNFNFYLVGDTASTDFPLQSPVQGNYGGNTDAFLSKFDFHGPLILAEPAQCGSVNVAPNGAFSLQLSPDTNPSTVDANAVILNSNSEQVSGTVTFDPHSGILTFQPDMPLAEDQNYVLSISSSIQDDANNQIESQLDCTFKTAAAQTSAPFPANILEGSGCALANNPRSQTRGMEWALWDGWIALLILHFWPAITLPWLRNKENHLRRN